MESTLQLAIIRLCFSCAAGGLLISTISAVLLVDSGESFSCQIGCENRVAGKVLTMIVGSSYAQDSAVTEFIEATDSSQPGASGRYCETSPGSIANVPGCLTSQFTGGISNADPVSGIVSPIQVMFQSCSFFLQAMKSITGFANPEGLDLDS